MKQFVVDWGAVSICLDPKRDLAVEFNNLNPFS